MSIVPTNQFNHPIHFGAESAGIVRRFHNENGDMRDIGAKCNEDTDCPTGNLCIESECYVQCDHEGNDCPFWHTCRDDLHETQSVCGPYTLGGSKAAMPKKRPPAVSHQHQPAEESWVSRWFGWLGF